MQVQNIDKIRFKTCQRSVDFLHHPAARIVPNVDTIRHRVTQLGSQHPVVPLAAQNLAYHGFRRAFGVHIGGIDVIHTVGVGIRNDFGRFGLVCLVAKHHAAQTELRNFKVAIA